MLFQCGFRQRNLIQIEREETLQGGEHQTEELSKPLLTQALCLRLLGRVQTDVLQKICLRKPYFDLIDLAPHVTLKLQRLISSASPALLTDALDYIHLSLLDDDIPSIRYLFGKLLILLQPGQVEQVERLG